MTENQNTNDETEKTLRKNETEKQSDENASEGEAKLLTEEHDAELIQNLSEEIKTLQDKVLRSIAESENIRSRMNKTIEETREYSITNFAKDLMPVVDNLSMTLDHLPETMDETTKVIVEGVKMTKHELEAVLKKHGIESIEPQKGDNFDYNNHHAISQLVTDKHKEGTIVSTMQVGYRIKDRLIRPASVVVAKK